MKPVLATIIGLAIAAFAATASAHVVEITTSIAAAKAADDDVMKEAIQSAIDDVVQNAIDFTPTLVVLHEARLVDGRIYLVLLIVDRDGEELMRRLATQDTTPLPDAVLAPAGGDATKL